jgi:hypothetical protein
MRELHPRRLGFAQVQFVLEVLVHDVDHSIAHPPQEEQRTNQDKREQEILAVLSYEKTSVIGAHTEKQLAGNEDHIGVLNGVARANQADGLWDPFFEFDMRFVLRGDPLQGFREFQFGISGILVDELVCHKSRHGMKLTSDSIQYLQDCRHVID